MDWTRSWKVVVAAAVFTTVGVLSQTGQAAAEPSDSGLSGRQIAAAPAASESARELIPDDITVTSGTAAKPLATPPPDIKPPVAPEANALPGPVPEPVTPTGDDALPTAKQAANNPYLESDSAPSEGQPNSGQQVQAYVPPTEGIEKDSAQAAGEQGQQLLGVLGPDVFNQRVNVTTPPDTDVAEVIRLLAERARINFIYGSGIIGGRVTLNIKDVPLGVALQSILASQDLALIREGENVFRIVRRKDIQQTAVETRTIYIKLNWVQAQSLQDTLQNFAGGGGSGNVTSVKASKEANTLIITDTPTNVALLRDIVAQLDVPEKQVMIEARMVELLIDAGRALGSDLTIEGTDSSGNSPTKGTLSQNSARTETKTVPVYDADGKITGYTEQSTLIPAAAVDSLLTGLLVGPTAAGSINFGGVMTIFGKQYDIAATLDGLETRRVANVLANPRVITINNQEAQIDIQREIPYLEAQQGVSQNAVSAAVKFKDAGIRLSVLPNITNNGFVRMKLQPEQRIKAGDFIDNTGNAIPIIDKRIALTNVIVKDEDTVVLGGLREITSADQKREFPWLGQAPILGSFFKNSVKGHRKNDLMLFVTPHIVKAPELTPAESYKVSRIDAHWDLPDYFFDDSVEGRESRHRGELDMDAGNYQRQTLRLPKVGGDATGTEE